jgi:rhamnulokinase
LTGGPLHLAIDLGATEGRGLLGRLSPEGLVLEEAHRFAYKPVHADGRLRWPLARILDGILESIREARGMAMLLDGALETVGCSSWGGDYGLLDAEGRLVEDPIAHRQPARDGAVERVLEIVSRGELFELTGMPALGSHTLFRLHEHVRGGLPRGARRLLMIADLVHHALCHSTSGEYTNAATTQLVDPRSGTWADELFSRLGLPRDLMPEIVPPGTELGRLDAALQGRLETGPIRVLAPATHDAASAVAGTPLLKGWASVCSGASSRVGVERDAPLLSDAARRSDFTNQGGAHGSVHLVKTLRGLGILEACRAEWAARGESMDQGGLRAALSGIEEVAGVVFPDDPRFLEPRSMTAELRAALAETKQEVPDEPVYLTKVVLDSLALRYASVVRTLESVTGETVPGIHIVGGGSLNAYLNQATANASGLPVLAGPAEATAVGNIMLQAVACGTIGSAAEGRGLVERFARPRRYEPRDSPTWRQAGETYREIEAARA